jgi:uncharacterized phage protein gp47/JayE
MAFNRPTLEELTTRTETDLQARLFGGGAPLRRSVVSIIARVFSGLSHNQNAFIDWVSRQILPSTAEEEFLDRHGLENDVERKVALYGAGEVLIFGSIDSLLIPKGTLFQRPDGFKYESTSDESLSLFSPGLYSATINIEALEAGISGNMDAETLLELVSPISGVSEIQTPTPFENGTDRELDSIYRARILSRIQNPISGGSKSDYEQWATGINGVTDATIFPTKYGPGSVLVTIGNYSAEPYSVSPEALAETKNFLELKRPVTAAVSVLNVSALKVNISIKLSPNIPEVVAAIDLELRSLFSRTARPGTTISRSQISSAISRAAGEINHSIESLIFDGSSVLDLEFSPQSTAILNNLSASDF